MPRFDKQEARVSQRDAGSLLDRVNAGYQSAAEVVLPTAASERELLTEEFGVLDYVSTSV